MQFPGSPGSPSIPASDSMKYLGEDRVSWSQSTGTGMYNQDCRMTALVLSQDKRLGVVRTIRPSETTTLLILPTRRDSYECQMAHSA